MPSKYIIHGATYCGDGTTSAEAASAGAAGAWNDINIFEGTTPPYGALGAGDVVYIRSKTSAGADITRTLGAARNLGSTAATIAAPICWVLDGGTVWSGINGTLTYDVTSAALTVRAANYVAAEIVDKLVVQQTSSWPGSTSVSVSGHLKNARITDADTNTNRLAVNIGDGNNLQYAATLESCSLLFARCNGARIGSASSWGRVVDCDIEITGTNAAQVLFAASGEWGAQRLEVIGGRVRGAGAGSMTTVASVNSAGYAPGIFRVIGMQIPRSMPVSVAPLGKSALIEMFAVDGGGGSHLEEVWGWATSRTDNNPPALSAQIPNSTLTTWAWRVYPRAASFMTPVRLVATKLFTGTAATKTVTLEFLVATTMSPTKRQAWITVEYTDDSTGLPKHITTFDPTAAALDTSTAAWSASTWGMVSFNKRRLAVVTPTAIKQDTPVIVTFYFAMVSATDQDILFVDHDFGLA